MIQRIAAQHIWSIEDAEDVCQDVLVKLSKISHLPAVPAVRRKYIATTAIRTAVDFLRKCGRQKRLIDRLAITRQIQAPGHAGPELDAPTSLNFAKLSKPQALALALFQDGHSYEDIARIQHVSIGTVRSRIFYARKKLKQQISA